MQQARRKLLKSGLGAGVVAATNAIIPARKADARAVAKPYDWIDPDDNLEALIKVMGDLAGEGRWWSGQGTIYATRPEHMTKPLLRVDGARYLRFKKADVGYAMIIRDYVVYRDLETREVIDEFRNPITGKVNRVQPILTGVHTGILTASRGHEMDGLHGEAWLAGRPLVLPWVEEGDQTAVTAEFLVKYSNGTVGSEIEHLIAPTRELHDDAVTSTSGRQVLVSNSPWLRWMEMGNMEGRTQWHSIGLKYKRSSDLRQEFRGAIHGYWPGALDAPESYEKQS